MGIKLSTAHKNEKAKKINKNIFLLSNSQVLCLSC